MRDLTPEELALAPEWATHYINKCFIVVFLSQHLRQIFIKEGSYLNELTLNDDGLGGALELPRKPFDITQHEWSDDELELFEKGDGCLLFCASENFKLNKKDGIAIAKALGLTAGDLK